MSSQCLHALDSEHARLIESYGALTKTPPHNLEAEQSTLGSMMLDGSACEQAAEILIPEDFYRHSHQIIFESLLMLVERDEPIDPITVCEELRSKDMLEKAGGREYVVSLTDFVPSAANVKYYAEIVQEKAILRKLLEASHEIQGFGYSESEDVSALLDRAEQAIFKVGQRRVGDFFYSLPPLLNEAWDRIEALYGAAGKTTGIPTGFDQLDYITSGLQPSDLVIVAARPSMGKTALALNMAVNGALRSKQPVAIFSLEMSKEQLVQRMLCTEARVNGHYLRTGNLRDGDWDRIAQASTRLQEAPIYIDDSPECTAMAMRAKCRRLKAEHGLGLIMVDYLQLMRWHRNTENRNQEMSEIARSLKSLAREMKVPVIALSQLSRQTERREGNKPMLSDLRESGAIEAEADVVMMIYRPGYYENKEVRSESDDRRGGADDVEMPEQYDGEEAHIIIAKQRNGPTGTVKLAFIPKFAAFENLAYGADDSDD